MPDSEEYKAAEAELVHAALEYASSTLDTLPKVMQRRVGYLLKCAVQLRMASGATLAPVKPRKKKAG